MTKSEKSINKGSFWQFALINNKLAEAHFSGGKILGYCHVKASDHKTKQEKKWIKEDTKMLNLIYRKGKYTNKVNRRVIESVDKI